MAAAAVTVMTVGGAALIIDHVWIVDQRDTLKSGANAAALAATHELIRHLDEDPGVSDATLDAALYGVAKRYVAMNLTHLPPDRFTRALKTLVVEVTADRAGRSVDVAAQADLGGFLFAGHLAFLSGVTGPKDGLRAVAAVDSVSVPVEVVLALDVSGSMEADLHGFTGTRNESRMSIVKRAAKHLVEILDPDADDGVAVGVVPWAQVVRLDRGQAARWEANGWARYPTRRVYGTPYRCRPAGRCTPPGEIEEDLPTGVAVSEAWRGCLDGHRMGGGVGTRAALPRADEFLTLPSANTFAKAYFVPTHGAAYSCLGAPLPTDYRAQICYEGDPPPGPYKVGSQHFCESDFPPILALTTDRASIDDAIDALAHRRRGFTYSALGVLWGQRLLEHNWSRVWGAGAHPVDPDTPENEKVRKAIVLLSDGEDTHCGQGNYDCRTSSIGASRSDACETAKDQGTEIFVIAAIHKDIVADDFKRSLVECSSQAEKPEGTYVFLENSSKGQLEAAFADIATQLRRVRRVQ